LGEDLDGGAVGCLGAENFSKVFGTFISYKLVTDLKVE
jgi:hypothetical protein